MRADHTHRFYLLRPVALADALELEKGEPIEWVVEDRNTLALKRPAKAPTKRRRSGGSR